MGIKVKSEEIAWMEEFGLLDQPVAARGATVLTLRAVLWITAGIILTYKGMTFSGTKIMQYVPVKGLPLIIPGVFFIFFGILPSKSVHREVQFLFMIRLIVKKLTSGQKTTKKETKKKATKIEKKKVKKGKKKGKPAQILKK